MYPDPVARMAAEDLSHLQHDYGTARIVRNFELLRYLT